MNKFLIIKCLSIPLLLLLPAYSFAGDIPASECPAVPAIIAAGIKSAEHDPKYPSIWTAINSGDHFGTENNWSLEIEFISAKAEAEAIAKGNAALKTLIFSGSDMFFCIYKGDYDGEEVTGRALKVA